MSLTVYKAHLAIALAIDASHSRGWFAPVQEWVDGNRRDSHFCLLTCLTTAVMHYDRQFVYLGIIENI